MACGKLLGKRRFLPGRVLKILSLAAGVRYHQQRGGFLPDSFRLPLLRKALRHQPNGLGRMRLQKRSASRT
jgi:hypothetical protein